MNFRNKNANTGDKIFSDDWNPKWDKFGKITRCFGDGSPEFWLSRGYFSDKFPYVIRIKIVGARVRFDVPGLEMKPLVRILIKFVCQEAEDKIVGGWILYDEFGI
jgi:hypothetical protein